MDFFWSQEAQAFAGSQDLMSSSLFAIEQNELISDSWLISCGPSILERPAICSGLQFSINTESAGA
ncbi:MAG: hypothetical protein A2X94_01380 [Bdellovibrionales bacterium GWB1_55_8]|nr:MAG: hypothetical protein A2X94_01380 [Bdellovibrionales bacterium GWB1_55_8]